MIREYTRHILSLLESSMTDRRGLAKIQQCDLIFFCHDVDRGVTLDGKAYSPIVDSVVQEFENSGVKSVSVALPGSKIQGDKGFNSPISINSKYLIWKIFQKCGLKPLDRKLNAYQRVLEVLRPKLAFTIGSTPELALAFKKYGVYQVELLHGLGYSEVPWGWEKLSVSELPHQIMAFDRVSIESFKELADRGVKISYMQHPFLRRFYLKTNLPKEWSIRNDKNYKKEILISLQWGYANDHGIYDELSGILNNGLFHENLMECIELSTDILWRFRLHPVQLRSQRYSSHRKFLDSLEKRYKNIEWKESSIKPLPTLLQCCSGHITMSSMSSYDAANFGVKTLALCPTLKVNGKYADWFLDIEAEDYLIKAIPDKKFILEWVRVVEKIEPRYSIFEDEDRVDDTINSFISNFHISKK